MYAELHFILSEVFKCVYGSENEVTLPHNTAIYKQSCISSTQNQNQNGILESAYIEMFRPAYFIGRSLNYEVVISSREDFTMYDMTQNNL